MGKEPFVIVTMQVPLPRERVQDVLVTAFEQACNYWYRDLEAVVPERQVKLKGDDLDSYWHVREPLTDEGVRFADVDGGVHVLNRAKLLEGIRKLAETHPARLAEIINEDDDAETADVFLQVCVFGEVVYG